MKHLYVISQNVKNGYDTFDSAVVCAESEQAAREIHPSGSYSLRNGEFGFGGGEHWYRASDWASKPEEVKVELIGIATEGTEAGVIVASFNAG